MTITIGAFSFGNYLHGTPVVPTWEFSRGIQRSPGVVGEQHLFGSVHGRQIVIPDFELYNIATHVLLQTQVALMSAAVGSNGDLVIDLGGGDAVTFTLCVFDNAEPLEPPWRDGSGVNGWQQKFNLHFRQVAS